MLSRRTRARLALLVELALLPRFYREWRRSADAGESPLRPAWFVAGLAYRLGYVWALDRNVGGVRTKRSRTAVLALVQGVLGSRFRSGSAPARQNFAFGGHVGHVVYRLWYGLLNPLPGEE